MPTDSRRLRSRPHRLRRSTGELAPGATPTGVYLFEFGADRAEPITIEVTPIVDSPIAVFVGPIS